MIVGEVNLSRTELIAPYLGDSDELHLAFDFRVAAACRGRPAHGARASPTSRTVMGDALADLGALQPRPARACARAWAAPRRAPAPPWSCCLTVRGTPFLYAGEELGLEDADVPPERVVDPGGRDGCRAPIPWTAAPATAGRPTRGCPGRPSPARAQRRGRARRRRLDPAPLPRALLALRRASPALHRGTLTLLDDAPDGVLAYERADGDDRRRVWINFAGAAVALPEDWVVELATAPTGGGLPPDAAAVLRPG